MTGTALWTASEVLAAIVGDGGSVAHDWAAHGVSIDTRTLEAGDIFFALSGPNFDAHDFVPGAFEKGAVAAVVTRDPGTCPDGSPLIIVDDVTEALQQLGKSARDRLTGRVIAVTGSVGKTGTKEMLRLAFSALGPTEASAGNLNNHWGLPLSLSRIPSDTAFTVLELGMNHAGEIRTLTKIARPHVAIITAIEPVHTEFFASVDEIAAAKAEIFEGVEPGGTAIINQDSPYFRVLSDAAKVCGVPSIVGFGQAREADVNLQAIDLKADGSDVKASVQSSKVAYHLGAPGQHVVNNSLSVLAAVDAVGGNVAVAASALADFSAPKGRGEHVSVHLTSGSFLLIDESYNASPASMRAAMAVAGRNKPEGGGRLIAVLGDMLELGDVSEAAHRDLLAHLQGNDFDLVFTAGQHIQTLWEALPEGMRGGHSSSPDKLSMVVASAVRTGDVVMVKGSLGSRVGVVVEALRDLDRAPIEPTAKVVNGN